MGSTRMMRGTCFQCGVETEHDIVAMHTDGIGFGFGFECPVCGKLVPEQSWRKYQKTGDVIVPNLLRKTRTDHIRGSKNYN